jgi:hypothetical protein
MDWPDGMADEFILPCQQLHLAYLLGICCWSLAAVWSYPVAAFLTACLDGD